MTTIARRITGGVDTHLDVHVASALDERGALLGVESFSSTIAGYRKLLQRSLIIASIFRQLDTVTVIGGLVPLTPPP